MKKSLFLTTLTICENLGFTKYYKAVAKKDQEAIIDLLYQFKTNLTPALKATIITEGTAETLLDAVVGYAEVLKNANITQTARNGKYELRVHLRDYGYYSFIFATYTKTPRQ